MLLILVLQVMTSSLFGVIAQAESSVGTLTLTDEQGTPINLLTMEKGETKTIGIKTTNQEDSTVQVDLNGLSLLQDQTSSQNVENQVSIAYSEEASNVIVSWQESKDIVQPDVEANRSNDKTKKHTLNEPFFVEPVVQLVNHQAWLVIEAIETGTFEVQARSSRSTGVMLSVPLSVIVNEAVADSATVSNQKESVQTNEDENSSSIEIEKEAKSLREASNYKASVSSQVWDLDTNTWGNATEITNYKQYDEGKGIKYTIALEVANDTAETIMFEFPSAGWGDVDAESLILTDPSNTKTNVSGNNRYGLVKPESGTYTLEFVVNFADVSAGVRFDTWFKDGFNYFTQEIKVDIRRGANLLNKKVETKAVLPRPVFIYFFREGDGESEKKYIEDVEFSIVEAGTDPQVVIGKYITNGTDQVAVGTTENKDFNVVVDKASGYYTSADTKYEFDFLGQGNYFTGAYTPDSNGKGFALKVAGPAIETALTTEPEVGRYHDLVKIIQTVKYKSGTLPESIRFQLDDKNNFMHMALPVDSKVVLYRMTAEGIKTDYSEIPANQVWTGSPTDGYKLWYDSYHLKAGPLKAGDTVYMETHWRILEPKPGLGIPNESYDVTIGAVGIDGNNKESGPVSETQIIMAYTKKAGLVEPEKEVWDADGNELKNGKNIQIGETIRYKIILEAKGDEASQIKITQFKDLLPEGLIADTEDDLAIFINGEQLDGWEYSLGNRLLTIDIDKILFISDTNKAARKLTIEIKVKVGQTASGKLANKATIASQTRRDDTVLNSWEDNDLIDTNEVYNYIRPKVLLDKHVYEENPRIERPKKDAEILFTGKDSPFYYAIDGSLAEKSGALYHGTLTDQLPEGLTVQGSTTMIDVFKTSDGIDQLLGSYALNDSEVWTQENGIHKLTIDLTKINGLAPMTQEIKFTVSFAVTADVSLIGTGRVVNLASVSGTDKAGDKDYETAATGVASNGFSYKPGELSAEKKVAKVGSDTSLNNQPVLVGEELTYTIVVKNTVPAGTGSIVKNVFMIDNVPEGLAIDKDSVKVDDRKVSEADGLVINGQKIKVPVGRLADQQSVNVTFNIKVTSKASGKLENIARAEGEVSKSPNEPVVLEESDKTETTNHIKAEPSIEKFVGVENQKALNVLQGQSVPYILIIKNKENTATLVNGTITDKLPSGLTYDRASISVTKNNQSIPNSEIVWNADESFSFNGFTLEAGETIRILYNVHVTSQGLTTLTNHALVTGAYSDKDEHGQPIQTAIEQLSSQANVTPIRSAGKLSIKKAVNYQQDGKNWTDWHQHVVPNGKSVQYQLVVSNDTPVSQPSEVREVILTDAIPEGLTYIKNSLKMDAGITGKIENNLLTVNVGLLKENEHKVVTFEVLVEAGASAVTANTAKANGRIPNNPSVPSDTVITGEKISNMVEIYKDPAPTIKKNLLDPVGKPITDRLQAAKGNELTYQLVVKNGEKDKTGILTNGHITDTLPKGLKYVAGSTKVNGKTINDTGIWVDQTLNYTLSAELSGGEEVTITFTVEVTKGTNLSELGVIENTAHVSGKDKDKNSTFTNEDSAEIEVVRSEGRLSLVKSATDETNVDMDNEVIKEEALIRYTLIVKNSTNEPSIVDKVIVKDKIPEGLVYQKDSLTVNGHPVTNDFITKQNVNVELQEPLKEGESAIISFLVQVTEKAAPTLLNTGTTTGAVKKNPNEPSQTLPEISSNEVTVYKAPKPKMIKSIVTPESGVVTKGDEITYRLVVTNGDENTGILTNGTVTDELPDGLKHVANTTTVNGKIAAESSWSGESLTVALPTPLKGGGDPITIEFTVVVDTLQLGPVLNTAKVVGLDTSGKGDYQDKDSVEIIVAPKSGQLKLTKTVQKDTEDMQNKVVHVGDLISYTIVVENIITDPSEVQEVTLTDAIPEGLKYQLGTLKVNGISKSDGHIEGQILTIDLATLNENEQVTVTFDVKITADSKGKMTNIATASGTVTPPGQLAERLPEITDLTENHKKPDPKINKTIIDATGQTINQHQAIKEQEFSYKLVVTNGTAETGTLYDGIVTDELPAGLSYVPETTIIDGQKVTDTLAGWSGNKLEYQLPKKFFGGVETVITFTVKVTVSDLGDIENIGVITGKDRERDFDINYAHENAEIVELIRGAGDLAISKEVKSADNSVDQNNQIVQAGTIVQYNLIVENRNSEPTEIRNTLVTDTIPDGLDYIIDSLTVDGQVVSNDHIQGQALSIDVGTLIEKQQRIVSFNVRVTEQAKGISQNIAYVEGKTTNTAGKETDMAKIPSNSATIYKTADPTIKKSIDGQTEVNLEGEITYRLEVSNGTEQNGHLLEGSVSDELPEGLSYKAGTTKIDGQLVKDAGIWKNNKLNYSLPSPFKGSQTTIIEFVVTVNTLGEIANTAFLQGVDISRNLYDKQDDASVTAVATPDPSIEKSVKLVNGKDFTTEADQVAAGSDDHLIYRLIVKNGTNETGALSDVNVIDQLPEGLVYVVNSTTINGNPLPDAEHWNNNLFTYTQTTMAGGEVWVIQFEVKVTETKDAQQVKNSATIDGNDLSTRKYSGESSVSIVTRVTPVVEVSMEDPENPTMRQRLPITSGISKDARIYPRTGEQKDQLSWFGYILVINVAVLYIFKRKSVKSK